MTKDQAKKILRTLLMDSKENLLYTPNPKIVCTMFSFYNINNRMGDKEIETFEQNDFILLKGTIAISNVIFKLDKLVDSEYRMTLTVSDLKCEDESQDGKSLYSVVNFIDAVKLMNFKLNSQVDVERYCQEFNDSVQNRIDMISTLFGKPVDFDGALVFSHNGETIIIDKDRNEIYYSKTGEIHSLDYLMSIFCLKFFV